MPPRSSVRRLKISSCLLLALLLCTSAAQAKTSCLTDSACKDLIERGRSQSKTEKYDSALAAYQDAYAQWPEPWLLVNIGRMQQKLGLFTEARDSFRRYLEQPAKSQDEKTRLRANEYLEQVEEELGKQSETRVTGKVPLPPVKEDPPTEAVRAKPTPVYKKWWFWTVVGAVAAGAAVGTGLGVYAKEPSLDGSPIVQPYKP